jgi:hypothetical protein
MKTKPILHWSLAKRLHHTVNPQNKKGRATHGATAKIHIPQLGQFYTKKKKKKSIVIEGKTHNA